MNKLNLGVLFLVIVSCSTNDAKIQQEKISNNQKCSLTFKKMEIAKNNLDSVDKEIENLQTGIDAEPCYYGRNCQKHQKIYIKRDSLSNKYNNLNQEFLNQLELTTKEYKTNYYTRIVKDLEKTLVLKNNNVIDLESGKNGGEKCTEGPSCPRHSEIYKQRDECKNQIDSISAIIQTIK